jgi:hypothetical protein
VSRIPNLYSVDECENKAQLAKKKEQKESPNDASAHSRSPRVLVITHFL